MNKRAFIYARFSDEDRARNGTDRSIDTQFAVCTDYATQHKIEIIHKYEDQGKSGTTITRRKGLQLLLEKIKTIPVDFVIVYDIDRLARNTLDYLTIKQQLKVAGAEVISVNQPMIDDSPTGQMIEVFLAGGAEYFARMSGERTKKVLEEKAKTGYYVGGGMNVPIGYKRSKSSGKAKEYTRYVFTPSVQSRYVVESYRLYNQGATLAEIRDYLHANGVRSKLKGRKVSTKSVKYMLSNPFYLGKFRWGKKIYDGKHEAIIGRELFDSVQRKLHGGDKHSFRRSNNFYIYQGLCVCSVCKNSLWAESHKRITADGERIYIYYSCRHCRNDTSWFINADKLDADIGDWLKRVTFSEATIEQISEKSREILARRNASDNARHEEMLAERQKLEHALERIEDSLFLEGGTDPRLKRAYERYKNRLEFLNSSLKILEGDEVKTLQAVDKLIALAKSLTTVYDNLNLTQKRKFLRLLIKQIIVSQKGIEDIEFSLPLVVDSSSRKGGSPPTNFQKRTVDYNTLTVRIITFAIKNISAINSIPF